MTSRASISAILDLFGFFDRTLSIHEVAIADQIVALSDQLINEPLGEADAAARDLISSALAIWQRL